MSYAMPDSKLDATLDQLGDVYAEQAAYLDEATKEALGENPQRPFMVMSRVKQVTAVTRTANNLLDRGVAKEKVKAWVEKTVTPTRTGFGHGYISPGVAGIFYEPMNPNLVNAMSMPRPGLNAVLPEIPVNEDQPLYGIITGQTIGSGSAPANDCSPWGVAGLTKICRQVSTLGRVGISTDPINLERLGHRVDRSDFLDYTLIGDPLSGTDQTNNPSGMGAYGQANGNNFLINEFAKIMREADVEATRRFARDIYTSNPSSGADAWHSAWFRGLDILVNTGQQDSVTQTACARADSKIINFATVALTGNNISKVAAAGTTLVDVVADLWYVLNREAQEAGLDPVEWTFAMSPEMFREVTAAWPCSYLTNRCLVASSSNPNVVMASDQLAMREEMRKGHFLWIDAQQVPVIVDSTITQTQGAGANAGVLTSTIYLLPLTVRGRFPVLLKTYYDFNGPQAAADGLRALGALAYGMEVSPDGKWLHNLEKTGTCFQLSSTKRPGLVLRTPYLAARITNVACQPRLITRSWDPNTVTSPSFYDNGGVYVGTGPSLYNPTTAG